MNDFTTPTKRCPKCERELPPMREYFFVDASCKDGFQSICKECKGFKFGARTIVYSPATQDGLKRCTGCLNEFPATIEYFHRNAKRRDGLQPRCKQCLGKPFGIHRQYSLINPKEGHRVCTKCKKEFPETSEHFYNSSKGLRGLSRICKACKHDIDLGYVNEHRDKVLEGKRKHGKMYGKRADVRARRRERAKQIYAANPIKGRLKTQKRIARRKSLPDTLTKKQWGNALNYFNHSCAICGNPAGFWTAIAIGHVVSLNDPRPDNLGTTVFNVIPMCHAKKDIPPSDISPCNNSIKDKHAYDWIRAHYPPKKSTEIINRIETYFEWVRSQE